MRSLLLVLGIAVGLANLASPALGYVCDIPTNGCKNGMFNQDKCMCDCIKPFCPDDNGDCTIASGSCGDPWTDCVRGENCPWWNNPMKAEACTTGPNVPAGLWTVYNTEEICCKTNFPYSESCMNAPATPNPTKYPTIAAQDDDNFEVIPMKFDVMGLPDGAKVQELKQEMLTVIKRIMLRLSDRIPGMKISSVTEKVVQEARRGLLEEEDGGASLRSAAEGGRASARRRLPQDISLYYNIEVIRDANKKFGPLIIQELRDSYDEVLNQIQTFSDTKFFSGDVKLNWCAFQNGKYELCVKDITPPMPARAPTPIVFSDTGSGDEGGLAGWAIALIIFFVLIIVCCIGYWIGVCFFGVTNCFASDDYNENKEIHNNIYMDDHRSYASSRRSRRSEAPLMLTNGDDRSSSRRSGRSRQLLLEAQAEDDGSFTINTYGTKRSRRTQGTRGTRSTRKQGRDPTMYIPGQEGKPDPDNDVLMLEDGDAGSARRYYEDPPLKPKRDPTMYQDGQYSVHTNGGDPPLKPQRDPTMFVEGRGDPSIYVAGHQDPSIRASYYEDGDSVQEMHNDYGPGGIDESEEYERYGYGGGDRRDPSYFVEEESPGEEERSFQTQEPSVSSKSNGGKSKKSSRSKKSSKSKKTKGNKLRKSLNSDWGSSFPDVGDRGGDGKDRRETKSFYN